jgi:hypothetical protein
MSKPAMSMALKGGAVRLTMSARVANDLGALQEGLKSLAERLGHPNCATGCDILHLMLERDFTLGGAVSRGEAVSLNPQPIPPGFEAALPQDPVPFRTVTVSIPERVNGDIAALTRAIAAVVDRLGCKPCCSGFDILFRRETDMLAFDEKLGVTGFGRFR